MLIGYEGLIERSELDVVDKKGMSYLESFVLKILSSIYAKIGKNGNS